MDTYRHAAEGSADRAQQQRLLTALNGWSRALRRDECGAWHITGTRGHVYTDGPGWRLSVECRSPRHWTATKAKLAFCTVTADGDDEGALRLDRLPSTEEAKAIRDALGIRKRKDMTEDALAALNRARVKSPLQRSTEPLDGSRLPERPPKAAPAPVHGLLSGR